MQKAVTKAALLPLGESEVAAAAISSRLLSRSVQRARSSLFRFPADDESLQYI